ncbi:MAG: hypothetical protein L0Y78_01775 [candidate division NC10 bacterium]|nr:hypothetical protein [candidate division NC10 bacterium]
MRIQLTDVQAGNVLTGLLILALSALLLGNAPPPRFVPGEVLVKFVSGTEGSATVTRASRTSPPDLGVLAPVIQRFQSATGVPLKAKQVTGGQWILVSVDEQKLSDELVTRLRGRANAVEVRLTPDPSDGAREASRSKGIVVRFSAGSAEAEAIAQKRSGAGDAPFSALVRALENDVGLPLKGEATADTTLLLHVDFRTLTLKLSDQLKALADIESAQPNYILRIQ